MVYFWSQKTCLVLGFIAWWSCLSSSQLLLLLMLWLLLFQDALNWCHSAFTSDGLRNSSEVLVTLNRVLSHLFWDESAVIVSHSAVASADFFFFFFSGEINTNQWTGKEKRITLKVILGFFLPEIPSVPSSAWSFQGLDGCQRGGKKKDKK